VAVVAISVVTFFVAGGLRGRRGGYGAVSGVGARRRRNAVPAAPRGGLGAWFFSQRPRFLRNRRQTVKPVYSACRPPFRPLSLAAARRGLSLGRALRRTAKM